MPTLTSTPRTPRLPKWLPAALVVAGCVRALLGRPPAAPPTLADRQELSPPGDRWKIAFDDEFAGTRLDDTKWSIGLPWAGAEDHRYHNDQYASYILDEDVRLSNDQLHLTCQKKEIKTPAGHTFHYSEGLITTSGKFQYTYGYAEVRAKAPMESGPGMWPAFWTLSSGWPPEFDVIELWTAEPRIHQGYAFRNDAGVQWDSFHANAGPKGFHTYGVEWGPGYIFFNTDRHVNKKIFGPAVTDKPQYLILNSGVCSGKGNQPPNARSRFPNSFDVDYCRVYARPDVPALHNPGFEDPSLAPWTHPENASVVATPTHAGGKALRVNPGAVGSEQVVYGLHPDTRYILRAWVRTENSEEARLGVKDHGNDETFTPATRQAYTRVECPFTTGPHNTTATIYCYKPAGKHPAYFDDVDLAEANAPAVKNP